MSGKITTRETDYAQWYVDIVLKAELADYAPVKGCMVIRPRGYALWESMKSVLDEMFKRSGHQNAYFPMLIPEKFIQREADHVEGFSPELAVVTHAGGEQLEEPYVLRPTSETIIWGMYKKWIQSYRDLPILINQWANVVRWEKRTRLFLRTTEFLWQEGHTAHETAEEAKRETSDILGMYRNFAEEHLAIPVVAGRKSDREKFAGAEETYAIEAMMQDRRALQAGTSHFLGQNFAHAFDVTFQNREGSLDHVWASSWGVSTRLIGALIMTHSDDRGLVIPPRIAPIEVVIVPIFKSATKSIFLEFAEMVAQELSVLRIHIDRDEQNSPGWRFAEWEMRGVPIRVEIGPRDVEAKQIVLVRRDSGEKTSVPVSGALDAVRALLKEIQAALLERAEAFRASHTHRIEAYADLVDLFNEGGGGFADADWCGDPACEQRIKDDSKATIRIVEARDEDGRCVVCGRESRERTVIARAY